MQNLFKAPAKSSKEMDSGKTAPASATWSWTVCLFISGVFFGTFISGLLLNWKSSLERKFRALLGYQDIVSAPPMDSHIIQDEPSGQEDTASTHPLDSTIIEGSPLSQEDSASTHSQDSKSIPGMSSSRRDYKYDVFLSFRGKDCSNFIAHLYDGLINKGIITFKNDEGLEIGETISSQLVQAIKDSRISIVVFSRDYANSTWCLDEMAAIVDCQKELKQVVFPVFYDVDPSDVRKQTGKYEDAFVLHTEKFEEDPGKVDRWKRAMTSLANSVGWTFEDNYEYKLIQQITKHVMDTLLREFSMSVHDLVAGTRIKPPTSSKVMRDKPLGQEETASTHPLDSNIIEGSLLSQEYSASTDSPGSKSTPSRSSSQRDYKYDVFLSFRGYERYQFIDHLYHGLISKGISTFKDDEGLKRGESISSQLPQAIKDSRISIVVFSRDYADSTWCLEEMATVVDCHRELNQIVIPVFYDVDTSDVRHQTGPYEDAFVLHKERLTEDPDKVYRWRRAMTYLADSVGLVVRDLANFTEIERIVQAVSDTLDHKFSSSADDLVGIQLPTESNVIKDSPLDQENPVSTHPLYSKSLQSRPSSQRDYKYDVFLSFRATDTGHKFTDHLCNCLIRQGISIFKNDERLEIGEPITSQLLQAIKDSHISIVVFTRGYADSTWCLEEMATIVDCHQELNQFVIPVFYDVDPYDVRKHTGAYRNAFVSFTKRFRQDPGKVHRWEKALMDLANLSGLDVRYKPKFSEIENIIQIVMHRLGHKFSRPRDSLVEIQSRVEYLEKLLKLEDDNSLVLGICGMAGIGKTTYASVLYDRIFDQFDACCFIEDVSQIYRGGDAIAVDKQILRQTLNEQNLEMYSPFRISGLLRRRLSAKRVLIVLDNVDEVEQLEKLAIGPNLLGRGSRFIITTRDIHILQVCGADEIYKVPLLNDHEARELFLREAFKSDGSSSNNYGDLITEVLKYTQNLPLAIKVVGSSLYARDATYWAHTLKRLVKDPSYEIMKVLQISFEELGPNEKEIFLHIACFFHGKRVEYVKRILDICGLYSQIGIQILLDKSLIIIENEKIHMHEMLQELGRKIIREEYSKKPALWSRLWLYEDFENALMSKMGRNNVKAIVLDQKEDVSKYDQLKVEGLSKMKNLTLLILYHKNFSGSLIFLSDNLRYLLWHGYPFTSLPSFEPYSRLVELNLPNSSIKRPWDGCKSFPCLERVDLSNSTDLMETSNFQGSPNIKRLDLSGCTSLSQLHPSIRLLKQLAYLNLRNCPSLVSLNLGDECELSSLRVLHLSSCTKLENTPDFTGLSNLEYLDLEQCTNLSTIHDSIGTLVMLKFLSLRGCTNLDTIPENVNDMTSLQTLDLSGCIKLKDLPLGQKVTSSSNIKPLIFLDLGFCKLRGVPDAIGELRCLKRLNLERSYFGYVPDTIKKPSRLAYLNLMHYCRLTRLGESLFGLHQGEDILKPYPNLVIIGQDHIFSTATGS